MFLLFDNHQLNEHFQLVKQLDYITSAEGIVDDDVDKCIHNLTSIGPDAMRATDDMVLDIMTHK